MLRNRRLVPNHSHGLRSEGRHCQILAESNESIGEPVQKLPYLYTYAYKFQTSIQSLKKRGQLYLIVIIARERLDTFGSFTHSMFDVWSTLLVTPASLLGQHVVKPEAVRLSCTWSWWFFAIVPKVPNRKFHWRIEIVCSYLPKISPKKPWSDWQAAAKVQRVADNDKERQCRQQSLDQS